MPRNQSEIAVAPPGLTVPCSPSAWWMRCITCGDRFTALYIVEDLRCSCSGRLSRDHLGAAWGHEWATVVHMAQQQRAIRRLYAEQEDYLDDNGDTLY